MKKILTLMLLAPMLLLGGCGIEIVDEGYTGVKKRLGAIQEETYPPGFYVVNPFTTNIIHMDNRVKKYTASATVFTKDVQQASVAFTVNYWLQAHASKTILGSVGTDYADKLIPQVILGNVTNVIGQWDAIELVSNRTKASLEIRKSIADSLEKRGIGIERFEITNLDYAADFKESVEAKVTAVQYAEKAENDTVRVKEEAKQKLITANAVAEAMKIKTTALSQSDALVAYEAVLKWDGKLPTMMMGDSSVPFIQLPTTK